MTTITTTVDPTDITAADIGQRLRITTRLGTIEGALTRLVRDYSAVATTRGCDDERTFELGGVEVTLTVMDREFSFNQQGHRSRGPRIERVHA